MGKKLKKKKREIKLKTENERKEEVLNIINKMNSLGLSSEHPGISNFYKICKIYIKTGEGQNGKIKLLGLKRVLEYILSTRSGVECNVNLKYNSDV